MPTNPPTTLTAIRTKVRKLTHTPSTAALPNATLDDYINTFVAYDMPDHLKLFDTSSTFSFYCQPYIDTYYTDTTHNPSTNVLYDFKNLYSSIDGPLYIGGYESYLSQSRTEFYRQYPLNNNIEQVGTGDGVTVAFSGTLSQVPILRNEVTFSSVDTSNNGLTLIDDDAGTLTDPVYGTSSGTIDYITGTYTLNWATAPLSAQSIDSQTVPIVPSRPIMMLYYDNKFILRPVPDQPYKITFNAFKRPTALADGDNPQLQDWWQYIAYGAAKKIFEDRMDLESIQKIMPEFKEQECLVLRKTLVNQTKERTATIYSEQTSLGASLSGWNRFF